MKGKTTAISLFFLAVMPAAPGLHAQSDEASATAQELMIRSGLSAQLRGFADQIVSDIRQSAANLDPAIGATLADAAKQALQPDALQKDIAVRVAKKLTLADMKAALAWLETDLGKRTTRAEELAATADQQRIRAFAEGLKSKPLAAKREQTISELVAATGAVRNAAAVAETMALGVALGMDSLQPRERRVGEAMLRAQVRQTMPPEKMQAFFGQYLPIVYAYTYREISDADLAAYVRFLKGVAGKRYQDGMNAAFLEGVTQASLQIGVRAAQRQRQAAL